MPVFSTFNGQNSNYIWGADYFHLFSPFDIITTICSSSHEGDTVFRRTPAPGFSIRLGNFVLLTDTHCHLYFNLYQEDLEAVLERAWKTGIGRILIPGIDLDTSRQAAALSERHPNLFAAVGVHPNDCAGWNVEMLAELKKLAAHEKVLAIGEIGLDYYREHTTPELQQQALRDQLELAEELSLPVVIHNRESWDDLWSILAPWQENLAAKQSPLANRPGVLHSFDGTIEQASKAIRHHFLIGVTGPVTFKNAPDRQRLVSELPLDSLLIETDSPYLTPQPFRGRRNEPAYVVFINEKIAELHQQPPDALAEITYQNAARLFRWDNID